MMPATNDRNPMSPRDQLESLMNETFGERTPRKLFKLCVAEFDAQNPDATEQFLEEFFYLSDEEAVEVCRGLINGLKPYGSRRADRDGRPKSATGSRNSNQTGNANNPQNRGNKRDQHSEERELVHN